MNSSGLEFNCGGLNWSCVCYGLRECSLTDSVTPYRSSGSHLHMAQPHAAVCSHRSIDLANLSTLD